MELIKDRDLSVYVAKLKELPAIPLKSRQLMALISAEHTDIDIDFLSSCIQEDPALTAKLVGMANSAYFSPSEVIVKVDDAIIKVLGLNLVKALVLSMLIDENITTSKCKTFPINMFWIESLSVAFLSKKLASLSTRVDVNPDECYLCALLHKIGLLAMAYLFPSEMETILAENGIFYDSLRLLEKEREIIGFDHLYAGHSLAHKWGLPNSVLTVISCQLDKGIHGEDKNIANLVSMTSQIIKSALYKTLPLETTDLIEKLGIMMEEGEQIEVEADAIVSQMEALTEMLSQ